jgi:hypothetical protein
MNTKGIRVALKLTFIVAVLASIITIALSLTGRWQLTGLAQSSNPKCDCWFPQDNKYGVKDKKGGCKIKDCEPPKAPPQVKTEAGEGVIGSCQPIQ